MIKTSVTAKTWFKFMVAAVALAIPAIIASSYGNAADHAADGHASSGLPMEVILQGINFFLYVGLIVYFARTPIANYFKNRQSKFFSALKRAEAARAEAQAKRAETQARLSKLESTRDESIQRARTEAAALRTQIVDEAKALSSRLQTEAKRTAEIEIERARLALREELLSQSIVMAQRILTDKMQDQDQKRLQDEFVQKIQSQKANQPAGSAKQAVTT